MPISLVEETPGLLERMALIDIAVEFICWQPLGTPGVVGDPCDESIASIVVNACAFLLATAPTESLV